MTSRHTAGRRAAPDLKRLAVIATLGAGALVAGSIVLAFVIMLWVAVFTVMFT